MAASQRQVFDLCVERRQVAECLSVIFHSVLHLRSMCKVLYRKESCFANGSIGTEDVDCTYAEVTYVRVNSKSLIEKVQKDIQAVVDGVAAYPKADGGEVTLRFMTHSKSGWFSTETSCWEEWVVNLTFSNCKNEHERQFARQSVTDSLHHAISSISSAVQRSYRPKMPDTQDTLGTVFDESLEDILPYHHKISFALNGAESSSTLEVINKLMRGTFALAP